MSWVLLAGGEVRAAGPAKGRGTPEPHIRYTQPLLGSGTDNLFQILTQLLPGGVAKVWGTGGEASLCCPRRQRLASYHCV